MGKCRAVITGETHNDGVPLLPGLAQGRERVRLFHCGEIFTPILANERRVGKKRGEFHLARLHADANLVAIRKGAMRLADVIKQMPWLARRRSAADESRNPGAIVARDKLVVGRLFIWSDVKLVGDALIVTGRV